MSPQYTPDELNVGTVLRLLGTWEERWRQTAKSFLQATEDARRVTPVNDRYVRDQQGNHLYSTGRADGLAQAQRRLRELMSEGGDPE